MHDILTLISGRAHPELAREVADYLGITLGKIDLWDFPDGEIGCKLEQNIRGRDVFLFQPTGPPVNDNLMELLIMIDACKRASAERITTVIPYFGYARQDRKDAGRVPITAKLAANMIVTAGADRVLTMDLHAAQIQGFFDLPVDHLYAAPILDQYFRSLNLPPDKLAIVSPDEGSIKRALHHQRHLGGSLTIVDKRRSSATRTQQANLIGEPLQGKIAVLFDDMISTAGSICGAADVAHKHGAEEIYISAAHAVFCGSAVSRLCEAPVKEVVVTNSLPIAKAQDLPNLHTVTVAPLLGEAIKRIHRAESVSYLFD
ncbi:ribose-phosphate diphosphokinase [Symmachiella dynata]|uniref:Ribose-phosphate pyrophosphokinase n=1 Tax=Symmachiella dynata TaxID=2527995 RepID=A0A517ZX84_9PLAN|nr:ribose-phosphate pyrophosphokinase [Symmachiella dynata]QDT51414.1 Ribose-phosphate pyrophosphokinase [Symmachiella dynata]QDU47109.1 Ribose-phosphate pyrophosphokinase [Symmachiella dynata]